MSNDLFEMIGVDIVPIDAPSIEIAQDDAPPHPDFDIDDPVIAGLMKLLDSGPVDLERGIVALREEHKIAKAALMAEFKRLKREQVGTADAGHVLANAVIEEDFATGKHLILAQDGSFWIYDQRVWKQITKKMVMGFVTERATVLHDTGRLVLENRSFASVVKDGMQLLEGLTARTDDPLGLREASANVINCTNGELHLDTMELKGHDPLSYLRIAHDVDYDPEAEAPVFDRVTLEIMDGNVEMQRHLHEVMALIMAPRVDFAFVVIWIGEGSNGKTLLIQHALMPIMGESIWSGQIESLNTRFGKNILVGKAAFVDEDVDTDTPLPASILKKTSELKPLDGEVKGGNQFQFQSSATPVILANDFPPVKDTSPGFTRRLNVIDFPMAYPMERDAEITARRLGFDTAEDAIESGRMTIADLSLAAKLEAEKSGIFNVLMAALMRVRERGGLDEPPEAIKARETLLLAVDSVVRFWSTKCVPSEGSKMPLSEFQTLYRKWCLDNG